MLNSCFYSNREANMIRADQGDTIKVKYTGRLDDGTVFDASPEDRPLHFIIGRGEVIPGFEEAVIGMYQGGRKTTSVSPDKAYGPRREDLIEKVERSILPDDVPLQVGRQLEVTPAEGPKFTVMVTGVDDETVTLDGNHPLAGRNLTFEIELLEVKKAPKDKPAPPTMN